MLLMDGLEQENISKQQVQAGCRLLVRWSGHWSGILLECKFYFLGDFLGIYSATDLHVSNDRLKKCVNIGRYVNKSKTLKTLHV